MTGEPPVLDTRGADDVVASLQQLASATVPQWRPAPGGDAGTMLQRGYARLLELVLRQLNQVPQKNLLAFLDVMGVSLLPPSPARVPLTFALAPGSPPTVVPAGTVAAAATSGGQPAVTFQTEAGLTVLPASLTAARVVDPIADRYRDVTDAVAGGAGSFSPFDGALAMTHALSLGTSLLPGSGQSATVTIALGVTSAAPAADVVAFFQAASFTYLSAGAQTSVAPSQVVRNTAGLVTITLPVGPVDQQTVAAPGLAGPITSQWLRTSLAMPLPFEPVAASLSLTSAAITVSRSGASPDTSLAGSAVLDTSKDFQPFGSTPQVGDAWYVGSDEVLGKAGASVQLAVTGGSGTAQSVVLAWEYLAAGGWTALPVSLTAGFDLTRNGTVTIGQLPDIPQATVSGQVSRWIRVRITAGGYGTPIQWQVDGGGVGPRSGTGDLDPPRLKSVTLSYTAQAQPVVLRQTDAVCTDVTSGLATGAPARAFLPTAQMTPAWLADSDPALYLGFGTATPGNSLTPGNPLTPGYPLTLCLACAPQAATGRVRMQPLASEAAQAEPQPVAWDYFNGAGWQPLPVLDGTSELSVSGTVTALIPADLAPLARFDESARYWLRIRAPRTLPADDRSLSGVYLNTVTAVQSGAVAQESLGSGNGQPGQSFQFAQPPVLTGQAVWVQESELPSQAEQQVIEAEEGPDAVTTRPDPAGGQPQTWVRWHEVATFVCSGSADRHYTLDHIAGTLSFGDGQHGLIPSAGSANVCADYDTGGGPAGNVAAGAVGQLLTPVPAVQSVLNPLAADGGAAAEVVPAVLERGPASVRNRGRAVSSGDFEWLARQAVGSRVARAICLPNVNDNLCFEPGWVTLIVVPQATTPAPAPSAELVAEIESYLEPLACADLVLQAPTRISVIGPGYLRIAVIATIAPTDLTRGSEVKQQVTAALGQYLSPLTGGPEGAGWELGRNVYISEIAKVIEGTPGVNYASSLRLQPSAAQRQLTISPTSAQVDAQPGSLVVTSDGSKAALLAEPVSAATRPSSLTVTGLREGDVITYLLDVTLIQATDPGATTFIVRSLPWPCPSGFLAGAVVVAAGGRRTTLAQAVGPPAAGQLTVTVADQGFADGLPAGSVITLVGVVGLTITSVVARTTEPVLDLAIEPEITDVSFLPGTVLGTLDGRVRLPLAEPAAPDPATSAITAVALRDFVPGDQVAVLAADGTLALSAPVTVVAPIDDLVYLDPNVLPYATGHQLDLI